MENVSFKDIMFKHSYYELYKDYGNLKLLKSLTKKVWFMKNLFGVTREYLEEYFLSSGEKKFNSSIWMVVST